MKLSFGMVGGGNGAERGGDKGGHEQKDSKDAGVPDRGQGRGRA